MQIKTWFLLFTCVEEKTETHRDYTKKRHYVIFSYKFCVHKQLRNFLLGCGLPSSITVKRLFTFLPCPNYAAYNFINWFPPSACVCWVSWVSRGQPEQLAMITSVYIYKAKATIWRRRAGKAGRKGDRRPLAAKRESKKTDSSLDMGHMTNFETEWIKNEFFPIIYDRMN